MDFEHLDAGYLAFEDRIVDYVIDCIVTFSEEEARFRRYGTLVSKGLMLYLSGERTLASPPDVSDLVLTDDRMENEIVGKILELYALVRVIEACKDSEHQADGSPFDYAQAMWMLMRIYNTLYDIHDIGEYLPDPLRKNITDARKATARHRMRIDD